MKGTSTTDPKGLIYEAFNIDGITLAECRSIFLDWALSLPAQMDNAKAIAALLQTYGSDNPDHPMTGILREGQSSLTAPRRRGGWRSRPREN